MTTLAELQELLYVENAHTENFDRWEKEATHPLARTIFRLAADKERNHIRWVELLIEIARAKEKGENLGVSEGELRFWIADEAGEGDIYQKRAEAAEEPWVKAALVQMGNDETTNSELLESLLELVSTAGGATVS